MWSQHSGCGQILSSGKGFWNSPANFVKQSVFHPTGNIMNSWYLQLSVSASPHCSHQHRTILFAMPYLSGKKSDLFLVHWMIGLWWQVFFPPSVCWEYGEKSLLFIPWWHFKSKLSLENVFWFSHLLTETHLLDFIEWNLRNSNPSKLVTCFFGGCYQKGRGNKRDTSYLTATPIFSLPHALKTVAFDLKSS